MKQQELADKIGINMQSLSKIERGLNYPAYETLEKIMEVLPSDLESVREECVKTQEELLAAVNEARCTWGELWFDNIIFYFRNRFGTIKCTIHNKIMVCQNGSGNLFI